jgi:adenosylcobyric acid synthase
MACAGVLPMLDHDLPDEDSSPPPGRVGPPSSDAPVVAIVRYPSASNLDEFAALDRAATVVRARRAGDLAGADLVILPGSKDVGPDLDWVRRTGLAEAVTSCAAAGGRVLGICGGLHMLGRRIEDPVGIEGGRGPWCRDGLGLLPVATRYAATKTVSTWTARFGDLGGPWRALAARPVGGYDVRLGDTTGPATAAALPDGRAWVSGAVLGVAGHGLLEDGDLLGALLGVPAVSACELWEASIDDLAGAVDRHLDTDLLARLTGGLL